METTELIKLIDTTLKAMEQMPDGYVAAYPNALEGLTPLQLLALADHYKVEPELDYGNKFRLKIGRDRLITATATIVTARKKENAREILMQHAA